MTRPRRETLQRALILALLVLITLIAFAPVLENQFLNYDDEGYVTENAQVRSGLSYETVLWAFTSTVEVNWHPLTWISHAIDCSLFGLDPRYHHAMNLLLHIASTVVLFLGLEKLTKARWQSAFVALVFAVHPLHVESVAWIAERKDVLSGLFWMLTMYAYVKYCHAPSVGKYLLTLLVFALGLLAKPMAVTLPFVLLLLDYWPLERIRLHDTPSKSEGSAKVLTIVQGVAEKIPLFALSLASSIVTYLVQQRGGSMAPLRLLSMTDKVTNAVVSYVQYLRKAFLPTELSIFYPHPDLIPVWIIVVAVAVIIGISGYVWTQRLRQPYLAVGWLWFLGTLVPVIGIVQVGLQAMADRYMYIPMIGLSIMVAWGLPKLPLRRSALIVLSVIAGTLMVMQTRAYSASWRDSITLFTHALSVTAGNDIAHNNLAVALADSGRHVEALQHLKEALRFRPNEITIHSNMARSLVALGDRRKAMEYYEWIAARVPTDPLLHTRMGDVLADEGRLDEAVTHYREVLRLDSTLLSVRWRLAKLYAQLGKFDEATAQCSYILAREPENSPAYDVLGIVAGRQQRNDEALKAFLQAIRLDSTNADAAGDLGILYERMGQDAQALEMYKKACVLAPQDWNIQFNLGKAFAIQRQYDDAAAHWTRAIALNPTFVDARANLAKLHEMQGRLDAAKNEYAEILRIDPENALAHFNLGNLSAKQGRFAEAETHFAEAVRLAPTFDAAQFALSEVRKLKPANR